MKVNGVEVSYLAISRDEMDAREHAAYQRGRREGLEEAAKDIELDLCEREEPFCICAERAAAIRALAEGEK